MKIGDRRKEFEIQEQEAIFHEAREEMLKSFEKDMALAPGIEPGPDGFEVHRSAS